MSEIYHVATLADRVPLPIVIEFLRALGTVAGFTIRSPEEGGPLAIDFEPDEDGIEGLLLRQTFDSSLDPAISDVAEAHVEVEELTLGPRALHTIDGTTDADGRIVVDEWTNDDEDRGYPNKEDLWTWTAQDRDEFDRRAGKSRIGASGVRVIVTLDGEEIS